MRTVQLGGLTVRLAGGVDGQGGGHGPVVILLHGFGAPGDDLVPLADVIDAPAGTRWLFPEGPLNLGFGDGKARAWWMIDMARIQADREAGRVRDLSQEIPKGLAPMREKMLVFLKEIEQKLGADPRRTVLGGFSQGAIPSCDALLHSDRPYAGLIQLSGNLLAQPVWDPLVATNNANITIAGNTTKAICATANGAVDISVTRGTAPYTYSWSNSANTEDLTGLAAGTYSITVTDANGCTATQSFTVTVDQQTLTLNPTVINTTCSASIGSISLAVSGGTPAYTYLWSNGNGTNQINNLAAGTYSVTVTDINGCSTNGSYTVATENVNITINGNITPSPQSNGYAAGDRTRISPQVVGVRFCMCDEPALRMRFHTPGGVNRSHLATG